MAVINKSGTPSMSSVLPPQSSVIGSGLKAGEAIAAGDVCYIASGGTVMRSNGTAANAAAKADGIAVRAAVTPLEREDIGLYLSHRLRAAGRDEAVFDQRAAETIWELSQGIPRRINQLCDLALLVGFVDELSTIGPVEIEAAAEELMSVAA